MLGGCNRDKNVQVHLSDLPTIDNGYDSRKILFYQFYVDRICNVL